MTFNKNRYLIYGLLTALIFTSASFFIYKRASAERGTKKSFPSQLIENRSFSGRIQPDGPYILSQRNNFSLGISKDYVLLSGDNGNSWDYKCRFPNATEIQFSHIFENGNILWGTNTQLYLSTDSLESYRAVTVKNVDGSDYIPHKPQNKDKPGWYFQNYSGVNSWIVNGAELLVWGNYGNVKGGATPTNIYYSDDNGESVRIAYSFGQNPYHRDNGTDSGGDIGQKLGDPLNPVFCRHVHSIVYNPFDDTFYVCTGDHDRKEGYECHWLSGKYDKNTKSWSWKIIISEKQNSRFKSGGLNVARGEIYWISDANITEPFDRGIFKCHPSDIANPEKHTKLYDSKYESASMIIQDNVILAGYLSPASPYSTFIIISLDFGLTWTEYDLNELGRLSMIRFRKPNGNGWFMVDLASGWIDRNQVLFIKPRHSLSK